MVIWNKDWVKKFQSLVVFTTGENDDKRLKLFDSCFSSSFHRRDGLRTPFRSNRIIQLVYGLWTEDDSGLPTGPLKDSFKTFLWLIGLLDSFMSSLLLLRLLKLSFIMFSLNMVDYPKFSLLLSTWNDLGHLPDTQAHLASSRGWIFFLSWANGQLRRVLGSICELLRGVTTFFYGKF